MLRKPWDPLPSHKFHIQVIGSKKRTFQIVWLHRFPWLSNSEKLSGAFCMFLYVSSENLVKKPETWKDGIEGFKKYSRTEYREQIFDGLVQDVSEQLRAKEKNETVRNKQIVQSIIEKIIFCGRQELSLHGHRDSGRLSLKESSSNGQNFRFWLRFRANHGDKVLTDDILCSAANAMYVSLIVQSDVIHLLGEQIQTAILERIKKSTFFTILANETTDISRVEQFSICIRYFYDDCKDLREDFLAFIPVYNVTGAGIAQTMETQLTSLRLNL